MHACRCLELTDNNPDYHLYAFSTGYLNLLGQVANLGCSAYITTDCISFMVQETNGHHFSFLESLLTYAGELVPELMHKSALSQCPDTLCTVSASIQASHIWHFLLQNSVCSY